MHAQTRIPEISRHASARCPISTAMCRGQRSILSRSARFPLSNTSCLSPPFHPPPLLFVLSPYRDLQGEIANRRESQKNGIFQQSPVLTWILRSTHLWVGQSAQGKRAPSLGPWLLERRAGRTSNPDTSFRWSQGVNATESQACRQPRPFLPCVSCSLFEDISCWLKHSRYDGSLLCVCTLGKVFHDIQIGKKNVFIYTHELKRCEIQT